MAAPQVQGLPAQLPPATVPGLPEPAEAEPEETPPELIARLAEVLPDPPARNFELSRVLLKSTQFAGMSLTAGIVTWALRSAGLISSLLASMLAWRHIDPLPVLGRRQDDEEDDDDMPVSGEMAAPPGHDPNEVRVERMMSR